MTEIAVLDDYQNVVAGVADWDSLGPQSHVVFFHDHVTDVELLAERLAPFEIIVANRTRTPIPRALIERLPHLRFIVTAGRRNPVIDFEAATERGIVISGTSMVSSTTAEHTWALILACARHIPLEDAALRRGQWQATIGTSLEGRTLGVVGLGRLGTTVATIGKAFGMVPIAWSTNLTEERASSLGVRRVEKSELFELADIVTIHLVLSPRTTRLIGAPELQAMRPGTIFVNTSRAGIVDTTALIDALEHGPLATAGLDVFDEEPLPLGDRLLAAPNTVLTPHLGYVTDVGYEVMFADAIEDIAGFLAGSPLRVLNDASAAS